jgi:anti-sigma28 factor (negative regulator of flagellin synthesis)
MIRQLFTTTHASHRLPRRSGRVAVHQPATRSWAEVEGHDSGTRRRPRQRARLMAPTSRSRADKIAQLRHAVEGGAYCVSAEQIAEKMVQEILADMLT